MYHFSEKTTISYIALISSLCFLLFDVYRRKVNPEFNKAFVESFGWLLREHEYYEKPVGATFYLFGVSVVLMLTQVEPIVFLSVLNLAFCDPIAAVVGSSVNSPKFMTNKTIAGSLGAAVAGVVVAGMYGELFDVEVDLLAAGVIALISEVVSVPEVDDNLTIPAISCVLWKCYYQDLPYTT